MAETNIQRATIGMRAVNAAMESALGPEAKKDVARLRANRAKPASTGKAPSERMPSHLISDGSYDESKKTIAIAQIEALAEAQPRAAIDPMVVADYRDALNRGDRLPPVIAFASSAKRPARYFLADGFHRLEAAKESGRDVIEARVRWGSWDDGGRAAAIWFAAGANADHGLQRTNADKRAAVQMALAHANGRGLSDRLIAEHCGVSDRFVGIVRAASANGSQSSDPRVGRDGVARKVKAPPQLTSAAREILRDTPIADEPAKLRQVARLAPERQLEVAQRVIEGASLSQAKRTATDDYPTPRRAVWALLQAYGAELTRVGKRGTFLEPAAGAGELLDHVDRVVGPKAWDVVDVRRPEALVEAGTRVGFMPEQGDYLERPAPKKKHAACIMNPPYSLAAAFVEKALREAELVCALLPLPFLASQERSELLTQNPPRVCILPERPSFSGDGATDAMEYAWFVWGDRRPETWTRLEVPPADVLDDDPEVTEARAFELDEALDKLSKETGSCVARVKPSPPRGQQLDLEVEAAKAAEFALGREVEAAVAKRKGGKR